MTPHQQTTFCYVQTRCTDDFDSKHPNLAHAQAHTKSQLPLYQQQQ